MFSSARRERGVVYLGGDGDPRSFRSIGQKSLPLLDAFLAALWCSRHAQKRGAKNLSPRCEKLSFVVARSHGASEKSHLFPSRSAPTRFSRRFFRRSPAGATLGRVDHRVLRINQFAFFVYACDYTPPRPIAFFFDFSRREKERDRHREKRPPKPAKETTKKERERERETTPPTPPTFYSP